MSWTLWRGIKTGSKYYMFNIGVENRVKIFRKKTQENLGMKTWILKIHYAMWNLINIWQMSWHGHITSITAKPCILWKVYFTEFDQNSISLNMGIILFWLLTSRRQLEAKNTLRRTKKAWRSWKSVWVLLVGPIRFEIQPQGKKFWFMRPPTSTFRILEPRPSSLY